MLATSLRVSSVGSKSACTSRARSIKSCSASDVSDGLTGSWIRHTRNPLYLGSILIACGFSVASRNWIVVVICLVLFTAIYLPVIRSEEQFLRTQFLGFDEYCEHVPRLFPRLRAASGASRGSFSRALYLQHREYNAALGTAAMLGALVAKLLWLQR